MKKYIVLNEFGYRVPVIGSNGKKLLSDFDNHKMTLSSSIVKDYGNILYTLSENVFKSLVYDDTFSKSMPRTIYKYISRCFSRSTPYGMSALFGKGIFCDEINNFVVNGKLRVDIDGEWAYKFVKLMEQKYFYTLKVRLNKYVILESERWVNYWNSNDEKEMTIFDDTEAIRLIVSAFEFNKYVNLNKLIELLKQNYTVEIEKIENFINQLLNIEFLVSDLKDSLTSVQLLDSLYNTFRKYAINSIEGKSLEVIMDGIVDLNRNTLKVNLPLKLETIKRQMNQLIGSEYYFNITYKNNHEIFLTQTNKNTISDFALFLTKISEIADDPLSEYKNKFLEKYGRNVGVPATHVLDFNTGIGDVFYNFRIKNSLLYEKLKRLISLEKDNFDIAVLENFYDFPVNNLHSGFEISFNITKVGNKMLYHLSPLVGSSGIGKILARFDHEEYFSKSFKNYTENNVVDVNFLPKNKRVLNVMNSPVFSDTVFSISASNNYTNEIFIDDIYIYLDDKNMFHIYSYKKNTEISLRLNNMLNVEYAPKFVKDLLRLKEFQNPFPFYLIHILKEILYSSRRLPRIFYKDVVLYDKSLMLCTEDFGDDKLSDIQNVKKCMKDNIYNYFSSDKIFLNVGDNRIYVNINSDIGIDILIAELKKTKRLILSEYFWDIEQSITYTEDEYFCNEFIFEIVPEKLNSETLKNLECISMERIQKNVFFPYDKYLCFNIYYSNKNKYDVYRLIFNEWSSHLKNEKLIRTYFFIRYNDPKQHIRLRFVLSGVETFEKLVKINTLYMEKLKKLNILKIDIVPYEREVVRYGGEALLDLIEKIFSIESEFLAQVICNDKNLQYRKNLYMTLVIFYIEKVKFEDEDIEEIFKFFKSVRHSREEVKTAWDNYEKFQKTHDNIVAKLKTNETIEYVFNEISKVYISKKISILLSIFHMLHNRLLGIDRVEENKLLAYTIKYIRKQIKFKGCTHEKEGSIFSGKIL